MKGRGLQPGPQFGEILTQLRSAWLDGEVANRDEEEALLERLLKTAGERSKGGG